MSLRFEVYTLDAPVVDNNSFDDQLISAEAYLRLVTADDADPATDWFVIWTSTDRAHLVILRDATDLYQIKITGIGEDSGAAGTRFALDELRRVIVRTGRSLSVRTETA